LLIALAFAGCKSFTKKIVLVQMDVLEDFHGAAFQSPGKSICKDLPERLSSWEVMKTIALMLHQQQVYVNFFCKRNELTEFKRG